MLSTSSPTFSLNTAPCAQNVMVFRDFLEVADCVNSLTD